MGESAACEALPLHGEATLNLGGLHCSYPDGSGNRQAITLAVHVKLCATQVEGFLELILE